MEEPTLKGFRLSESLVIEIEKYNKKANKKIKFREYFFPIFWSTIVVLLITLFSFNSLSKTLGSVVISTIVILIVYSFLCAAFYNFAQSFIYDRKCYKHYYHLNTNNLEDYKAAFNMYSVFKKKLDDSIEKEKRNYWNSLNGYEFEEQITNILRELYDNVEHTNYSNDGGIDIIYKDVDIVVLVQCKAQNNLVTKKPIRDFLGAITHYKKTKGVENVKGLFVSRSGFNNDAYFFCKQHDIDMWDIKDILSCAKINEENLTRKYKEDYQNFLRKYEEKYKITDKTTPFTKTPIPNETNSKLQNDQLNSNGINIGSNNNNMKGFVLYQNEPNPFSESTIIKFYLPQRQNDVCLIVCTIYGKEIQTLLSRKTYNAGEHSLKVKLKNHVVGELCYKLISKDFADIKKMTIS